MASLVPMKKSGIFKVAFRYAGRQYQRSLGTKNEKQARGWLVQIEEILLDLERGRLEVPEGVNFSECIKSGGKRTTPAKQELTFSGLFAWYFSTLPDGNQENNTLATAQIHAKTSSGFLVRMQS